MITDYEKIYPKVAKIFRRIYVMAFNVYLWYWLFKLIWIKPDSNWEDYLIWFFAGTGAYFFIFDSKDNWIRKMHNVDKY